MRLFFEPTDESACSWQRFVKVIDPNEQEEAVPGRRVLGARQRGMPVGLPLVKAEQDRSVRVQDLPEVIVGGGRLGQAK